MANEDPSLQALAEISGNNDAILAQGVSNLNTSKAGKIWTLGMAMACTISWSVNKSVLWMLFHGVISWAYVIFYAWGFGR
jgi:hypothetical protein